MNYPPAKDEWVSYPTNCFSIKESLMSGQQANPVVPTVLFFGFGLNTWLSCFIQI